MTTAQHFIVSSTSAVAEGRQNANETAPIFLENLTNIHLRCIKDNWH